MLSYFPVTLLGPVLSDGSWTISPRVDHQIGRYVSHCVRPSSGKIEDLSWSHLKGHWCSLLVQRELSEIRFHCEAVEYSTPF